jgi:hypothetical protein
MSFLIALMPPHEEVRFNLCEEQILLLLVRSWNRGLTVQRNPFGAGLLTLTEFDVERRLQHPLY